MSRLSPHGYAFVVATAFTLLPLGCGSDQTEPVPSIDSEVLQEASAHDLDDVPITEADVERPEDYANAVARIRSYRDTIRDEIAAGRPTKAHRPLDELDIVLNWLPEITRDTGVPKEDWESINTTAQGLRESFNKVHAQIDAGEKPDFEAVAGDIRQGIERLESVRSSEPPQEQ